MSRVPVAGVSPVPASAAFRAHMVRVAPAKPLVAAARPASRAPSPKKVRRRNRPEAAAKGQRRVVAHRTRPKAAAPAAQAAASPPVARPVPWAVADAQAAPRAYALVPIVVCNSGAPSVVPLIPMPARAGAPLSPNEALAGGPVGPEAVEERPLGPDAAGPLIPVLGPGSGTAYWPTGPVGPTLPAGAVPEPQTWALLILGFGAVGAQLRRRRAARPKPRASGNLCAGDAVTERGPE